MLTKYILGAAAILFLVLAVLRTARSGAGHPQVRTWLLIAVIFGAVATYLFMQA